MPEIRDGDDVASAVFAAQRRMGVPSEDGDIYVVAQKIVSKSEGMRVKLDSFTPSAFSSQLAAHIRKDPREVEVILRESRSIIRARLGILITETRHGLVCANAGVDRSNLPGVGEALLLPRDPDRSAARIRKGIEKLSGRAHAVIISDTFGRPWREGQVDFAIGVSGISCFRDYRRTDDAYGREMKATNIAQVDELAAAAELIMGKARSIPAVLVKGYTFSVGHGSKRLMRRIARDLFR